MIKYTPEDLIGFMAGSRLGDGAFVKKGSTHNTYIVFKHAENEKEYLLWKMNFLKAFWVVKQDKELTPVKLCGCFDNAQNQFSFNTKTFRELNWYKNASVKEIMSQFNEMALSVYALDDGSVNKHTCKISCGMFTDDEKDFFIELLKKRFDIDSYVYSYKKNSIKDSICISGDNYFRLVEIIKSKIPNDIDVIRRKVGVRLGDS